MGSANELVNCVCLSVCVCAVPFTELVSGMSLFGCFPPHACCGQGAKCTSGVSASSFCLHLSERSTAEIKLTHCSHFSGFGGNTSLLNTEKIFSSVTGFSHRNPIGISNMAAPLSIQMLEHFHSQKVTCDVRLLRTCAGLLTLFTSACYLWSSNQRAPLHPSDRQQFICQVTTGYTHLPV